MALPDFQSFSRFRLANENFSKVNFVHNELYFFKKGKLEKVEERLKTNPQTTPHTYLSAMSLFKLASSFKSINNIYTPISIRSLGNKLHHLRTKKSITSRLKIVAQGPTKPIIPNTEVEPPVFKIMTKHTGVQHGIAKKDARRVADRRGYREPTKLVKKYIKYFVHDKKIRKLIDW